MLLVRGMTPELFYGREGGPGLRDVLTVHTSEKVNINTASQTLLAAMVNPSVRMETAMDFARAAVDYRRDPRHDEYLRESDWYRNRVAGYNDIQLPGNMVATTSNTFSVQVQADVNGIVTSMFAVLRREQQDQTVRVSTLIKEVR
jgi:general secretion pathway protein K